MLSGEDKVMEFGKIEDTMFSKQHSDDIFEFIEYGDMDENSKVQLFFVRNAKLAFSDLTKEEVLEVIKPYYSSLEELKSIYGEDYKEAILKCYFQELSSNSAAQHVGNKRIQIINTIFNINSETCLRVLKEMGLTINELEIEVVDPPEQSGEYPSEPIPCASGEKEIQNILDTAISEINYALKSNKSKEVKQFYLENAIRFIDRAKEELTK